MRKAADFLESKPELLALDFQSLRMWLWDGHKSSVKEQLQAAARQLGSFTKTFTDNYFELHKSFGAKLELVIFIDRDKVCKKIVTWEGCNDDGLLADLVDHAQDGAQNES